MKRLLVFLIIISCNAKKEDAKDFVTVTYNKKILDDTKIKMQNSFIKKETDLIFLGDSKTEGFPLQEMFNDLRVKNRGIAGNTTKDVLSRLQNITSGHPNKIFLEIGLNDLSENVEPQKVFNNFTLICSRIKKESPNTKIFVQSVLPTTLESKHLNSKISAYNDLIKKYCHENNIDYIDLNPHFIFNAELNRKYTIDGVHLNIEGYKLWKDLIVSYVK